MAELTDIKTTRIDIVQNPAVEGALEKAETILKGENPSVDALKAGAEALEAAVAGLTDAEPELAAQLNAMIGTIKDAIEQIGGEEPQAKDEEQPKLPLDGKEPAQEAGRVLSRKSVKDVIAGVDGAVKTLTALDALISRSGNADTSVTRAMEGVRKALGALKSILAGKADKAEPAKEADATRATESVEVDRMVEALDGRLVEVVVADADKAKPYIEADVIIAKVGRSANGNEYTESFFAKSASKFAGVPMYEGHHSDRELREHPDGIPSRLCGRIRKSPAPYYDRAVEGLRARAVIFRPSTVETIRAAIAADSIDLFNLSMDIRVPRAKSGANRQPECASSVFSVDLVQRPAAGGTISRIAASKKEVNDMDEKEKARKEELARLADNRLIEAYAVDLGLSDAVRDDAIKEAKEWRAKEEEQPTPEALKARLIEYRDTHTPPPDTRVKEDTQKVEAGEGWEDKLGRLAEAFFDRRNARGMDCRSLQQFVRAGFSMAGADPFKGGRAINTNDLSRFLTAVEIAHAARNTLDRRRYEHIELVDDNERQACAREMAAGYMRGEARQYLGDKDDRLTEAITSTSVAQIFADRMHKTAIASYEYEVADRGGMFPGIDRLVSAYQTATDTKTYRFIRLQALDLPPVVAEGGPYLETTTPADEEATSSVTKYGMLASVTMEAIAGDDVGILRDLPTAVGGSFGRRVYRVVYDLMRSNTACTYDSVAVIAAAHSNDLAVALSYANAQTLAQYIRGQIGYSAGAGSDRAHTAGVPTDFFVPNALYASAVASLTGVWQPGSADRTMSSLNNSQAGISPLRIWAVPYWDTASETNNYYMTVDAKASGQPPLVGLLLKDGRREPEVFSADVQTAGTMFTNDTIQYKGRHWVGAAWLDHRGIAGSIVP